MPRGACDAIFHLGPLAFTDIAGAFFRPVLPNVAPATQNLPIPVAAQHRTRRQIYRWQIHRYRAHQKPRRRLVAAAHQHRSVDRLTAQQFLSLHREKVAIHHRARLAVSFGDHHRWQLDRKTARLPNTTFYFFSTRSKMAVTNAEVAPGVDDRDHGLSKKVFDGISHLLSA